VNFLLKSLATYAMVQAEYFSTGKHDIFGNLMIFVVQIQMGKGRLFRI
jgi:hypothetical protein